MDETSKAFANELISRYGADRFYHSSHRTGDSIRNSLIYAFLNENCTKDDMEEFFRSIGLPDCRWVYANVLKKSDFTLDMCRIAYGLSRYWKEFGLKTYKLPDHLHLRMILGEKNEWVKNYIEWIKKSEE